MPQHSEPVAAVIATYRRPAELQRLLSGLAAGSVQPDLVMIIDNAASPETAALAQASELNVRIISLPSNPGPGAAWKCGMEHAWEAAEWFFVLDDDVVIGPRVLEQLLAAGRHADVVAPLLSDSEGNVWAFPEPANPALRSRIREARTPADCLRLLGPEPHEFCWCTGACMLVSRRAVEKAGFHRTDFHMLGEDLEFSMRLSTYVRSVFLCDVDVPHLPPIAGAESRPSELSHRRKFLSLLQNLTYLTLHSPHSRHLWRYLPGNFRRYFRTMPLKYWWEALWAGLGGAAGQPAGGTLGRRLRQRLAK